ncbi:MAG: glycerate kinase [Ruminococcaceae bacterium]|nr:glycerate kinase [Oscillospiraceae bacterium]
MKITVALDSFKGSIDTFTSAKAVSEGIKRVFPDSDIYISPLADGGEGTVDAVVSACSGKIIKVQAHDPLGRFIESSYGFIEKTQTAIIEMAASSGITIIKPDERDPLYTTTRGVGDMILDAIKRGCRKFIIGIGGSATNDGGVGMLSALGFSFLDKDGNLVPDGAIGLRDIVDIQRVNVVPELSECSFSIACDVKNPLCGENGCSRVFGPQKGASSDMIDLMDVWLQKYADLTKVINPDADPDYHGSGAAGGLGFAFMAYLGGKLTSGVDLVIKETGLEEHIKNSDYVITGEGRLDGQSYMGKAPIGVAKLAKKYSKPVIAFAGCVTDDAKKCNEYGIDAFFPILKVPCDLTDAMDIDNAYKNLSDMTEQVFRLIKIK